MRSSYLGQYIRTANRPTIHRRIEFAVVVLISQLLLIALAIAWLVHMLIIAANGSIYFVEKNPLIL